MPQPLSKVVPKPNIAIDALYVLNYPEFATQVMRVIAHWAHIDGNLASILSRMLKADIEVGTAMYTALSSAEARKSALLAAAEISLSETSFLMMKTVLKCTAHSRTRRNEFAHHVWGVCEQVPGALLLLHPNVILQKNVSHRQRVKELPDGRGVIAPKGLDYSKVFVFKAADFQKSVEDASQAEELSKGLYSLVAKGGDDELRWLLQSTEVRRAAKSLMKLSALETQQKLTAMMAKFTE